MDWFYLRENVSNPIIYQTIQNISIYTFMDVREKGVDDTLHTDYTVTPMQEEESKMAEVTREDSDFTPMAQEHVIKYTLINKRQRHVELRTWS